MTYYEYIASITDKDRQANTGLESSQYDVLEFTNNPDLAKVVREWIEERSDD